MNNNAQDVAAEIQDLEGQASELYNLVALTQNSIRQQLREVIYGSTRNNYVEAFINSLNLDSAHTTATFDYSIGLATLPLLSDTEITPATVIVGSGSQGSLLDGHNVSNLIDEQIGTYTAFSGNKLELIITFPKSTIINRIILEQDDYKGLRVLELTGSSDGVVYNDLTKDLTTDQLTMDGTSGKFSGEVVLDIQPKSLLQIRIVLEDATGQNYIALRGIHFHQRQYDNQAQVQTNRIDHPTGSIYFAAVQNPINALVSITHMISYDGVNFQAVQPNTEVKLAGTPFWYRGVLQRNTDNISVLSGPLAVANDPHISSAYTVSQTSTLDLGNNVMQRTISFASITGPVTLQDSPLPGTFSIWQGTTQLPKTAYTFSGNVITFPSNVVNVNFIYQASSLGNAGLTALINYYSPYLYEVQFEQV